MSQGFLTAPKQTEKDPIGRQPQCQTQPHLASLAEPELGTTQAQLVICTFLNGNFTRISNM